MQEHQQNAFDAKLMDLDAYVKCSTRRSRLKKDPGLYLQVGPVEWVSNDRDSFDDSPYGPSSFEEMNT